MYDFSVGPDSVYPFEYELVPGTAADVRQVALANRMETASSWSFPYAPDHEGWSISDRDDGKTTAKAGTWTFAPAANRPVRIVSPPVTFPAARNQLRIRLRNGIGAPAITLSWKRSGLPERSVVQLGCDVSHQDG